MMAAPSMQFGTEELKPTMMLPSTHGTGDIPPPKSIMADPTMPVGGGGGGPPVLSFPPPGPDGMVYQNMQNGNIPKPIMEAPMMPFGSEPLKPTMALPITTTGGDKTPHQFNVGGENTPSSTNGHPQMMTTTTSWGTGAHQINPNAGGSIQFSTTGTPMITTTGTSAQGGNIQFSTTGTPVITSSVTSANGGGSSGGMSIGSGTSGNIQMGAGPSGGMSFFKGAGSSGGGLPPNFKGKLPAGFDLANLKGQLPPGVSLADFKGLNLQQNGANGVTTVTTTSLIPKCKDLNGVEIPCPEGYQNGPPMQQGWKTTWNSIKSQYPSGGVITTEIKTPPPGWIPPPVDNSGTPPPQIFPTPFPSNGGTSIPTLRPRPRPSGQSGKLFTVRFTIL